MANQAPSAGTHFSSTTAREDPKRLAKIELWRSDLRVLLRVLQDSRTPRYVTGLMLLVLLWGLLPVDPLPDAIPLAGIIDDVTVFMIVRTAIYRIVPDEVVNHHAEVVSESSRMRFGTGKAVASIVVIQLILIAVLLGAVGSIFI